jgi:hypothetical protein
MNSRRFSPVVASVAKQSVVMGRGGMDCFVAAGLATTGMDVVKAYFYLR